MNREEMIEKIKSGNSSYDFIIIGGGATGIGILNETISRGYSAVLFESSDFTKSTSGKSTKLVHGGVRYLAQGNVGLVREASIERGRLLKNAPKLVKNTGFVIPTFKLWETIMYTLGLKFYDLLAGSYSFGKSRRISREKLSELQPNLKTNNRTSGVFYHDGQFDDSRLAIDLLKSATLMGGIAINYMPVKKLHKNQKGILTSVEAEDLETGNSYRIKGKCIINASGVFADSVMEMDQKDHKKSIRPSQGIHLIVDKKFLPGDTALMIPKTDDGRVLFAVPWHNRLVLGTTDTPVENISHEPKALESEIDFILTTLKKYLIVSPEREDILSVFAGLRPLAATGEGENKTKEISRSHKILISPSGLYSIIGGKWTTYRKMAEDMINKVEKDRKWPRTKSLTRNYNIYNSDDDDINTDSHYFINNKELAVKKGSDKIFLSEKLQITEAHVLYATRNEMARKPEDVLARRTRALLLDARESLKMVNRLTEIMATELKKDQKWIDSEIIEYKNLVKNYIPAQKK